MDFETYVPTRLEESVVEYYRKHGISDPQDIDLDYWANEAGIVVRYIPRPSTTLEVHDRYFVVIDERLPEQQQRVELAHELGHVLMHVGRQDMMNIDLRARQEYQADRFAAYMLAPTFMIANCITRASSRAQLISQLAGAFDVPDTFMNARLKLLEDRMYDISVQRQMAQRISEERSQYDYGYRHPLDSSIEYLVKDNRVIGTRRRARL